ncbi:MAG: hypothetical protein KME47_19940 [Nodosilinea sp. WJT8-NPBG4]|jgi:hypothetical protein|nr:hypothetical protein [Nodosilinea sp. WJT8-NPBG4]
MYIAQITACQGHNELSTFIYKDRPIISVEIDPVRLQLEELLGGPASYVVSYSREDDQTMTLQMSEGI